MDDEGQSGMRASEHSNSRLLRDCGYSRISPQRVFSQRDQISSTSPLGRVTTRNVL